jgi:hypothetical protein
VALQGNANSEDKQGIDPHDDPVDEREVQAKLLVGRRMTTSSMDFLAEATPPGVPTACRAAVKDPRQKKIFIANWIVWNPHLFSVRPGRCRVDGQTLVVRKVEPLAGAARSIPTV